MSPLFLVGIILFSTAAHCDVKHVLDGSASPPSASGTVPVRIQYGDPQEVNNLAHHQNAYQSGNPRDFWWMNDNSPLKASYEYYKKCSLKGTCTPSPSGGGESIKANPFLNGDYQNEKKNKAAFHSGINLKKNPFLNGQYATTGNGEQVSGEGGFIGVQPQIPFGGQKQQLSGQSFTILGQKTASCEEGSICVAKELCINGIVNKNGDGLVQARNGVNFCNNQTEICCRLQQQQSFNQLPNAGQSTLSSDINDLSFITAGKSSVPGSTIKFAGGAGLSPGQIQILPEQQLNLKPNIYLLGESGSHASASSPKPIRDTSPNSLYSSSSTIDYSDTKFDDAVRFASTLQGPAYLPPIGSPKPPTRPPPPPLETPSRPSISTTYQPRPPPTTPSVSQTYVPTPRPSLRPFPSSPPTYLPPGTTATSPTKEFELPTSQNEINNQYVSRPTTTTTRRPTNGYLPPSPPNEIGGGSDIRETYLRPTTPRPEPDNTGDNNNRVSVVVSPTRQPQSTNLDINTAPPPGCAAALKCVQEIYCTAEGVISPVPVVLTKEQELSRVPTTVCQDLESGIIGKCCRDPNYKDPWPSANLVDGVDDGQYKEDPNLGQYSAQNTNRIARSDTASSNVATRSITSSQLNQQLGRPTRPSCGQRNTDSQPLGPNPTIDANFAEFPWQAMILRDTNRSLLCGGAIIRRDAVLTAAHCVEGLETNDVLVKGGEWKLGIDEEPLPFQIVKVVAILRHPDYKPGSFQNDLAVLVLQEKLRPTKNIGTICLPQPNQIPTQDCVATGWGKRILQLHAKNAIMHRIEVKIMDNQQCEQALTTKFQNSLPHFNPNTLCGYSDVDQCKVDYGSALACANGNGFYTLSGIYSWDTGCKTEGQIGGYVAPDVEWIESVLSRPLREIKQLERENLLKYSN